MKLQRIVLLLSLVLLLPLLLHRASAQKLDTIQLRYHLKAGQEVRYRVLAVDSIVLYDTKWRTLSRERAEMIVFRCDSVLPDDSGYVVTVRTTGYAGTDRIDSFPPLTRDTNAWVGRTVTYRMSTAGKRVQFISGTDEPGTAPGGPFEPLLFPFLAEEKTWLGSSGAFDNNQWIFDNIYPPIKWNGTVFRTVGRRLDTLKQRVIQVGFSETGAIAYKLPGNPNNPTTTARINGGGEIFLAPKLGYPIVGNYNLIATFTLVSDDGKKVDGRHIMALTYNVVNEKDFPTAKNRKP